MQAPACTKIRNHCPIHHCRYVLLRGYVSLCQTNSISRLVSADLGLTFCFQVLQLQMALTAKCTVMTNEMRMRKYKREHTNSVISFYSRQIVTSLHNSSKVCKYWLSKCAQPRHYVTCMNKKLKFCVICFIFLRFAFHLPMTVR